jgi:heat shock protein HslJ
MSSGQGPEFSMSTQRRKGAKAPRTPSRCFLPRTVCTILLSTVALGQSAARELGRSQEGNRSMQSTASQKPDRRSLKAIESVEWVLEKWDHEEDAPDTPRITLSYDGGRFVGNGGCNRYFAPVTPGSSPGDIAVGAVGATRMFCPDPTSAIEARFLKQLAAVKKFEVVQGKLALGFEVEGKPGVMLFAERDEKK